MYSYSTLTPAARPPLQSVRLLDQVRERIRYLHYSLRTEQACMYRVRAFDRRVIVARDGRGGKDRVVMLPQVLLQPLKQKTARARGLWDEDRPLDRIAIPA